MDALGVPTQTFVQVYTTTFLQNHIGTHTSELSEYGHGLQIGRIGERWAHGSLHCFFGKRCCERFRWKMQCQ